MATREAHCLAEKIGKDCIVGPELACSIGCPLSCPLMSAAAALARTPLRLRLGCWNFVFPFMLPFPS